MLLISEVGREGRRVKLYQISLGCEKFRGVDPDLRGDDSDGTGKFTLGVEDRGADTDGVVDILTAGDRVAILTDFF